MQAWNGASGILAGAALGQGDQITATPQAMGTPAAGSAATGAPGAQPIGAPGGAPPPGLGGFFWIMIAMLGLMVFMSIMTGRREKKKRAELMNSLKKKDKVLTMAGIIGTIEELGDQDVTLVVDQANNTRIKFSKASIQHVIESARPVGVSSTTELKAGKPVTA
jgi:preprotein translocase subunit YajC